jgi:hypothetical protein
MMSDRARRAAVSLAVAFASVTGGVATFAAAAANADPVLMLDTHSSSANPTVSTPDALQAGVRYLYEVDGTFSYLSRTTWNTHIPWCGPWEATPTYPSSGADNYHAAIDASVAFAAQTPCGGIYSGQRSLVIDSGDGTFRRIAPVGGEPRLNFASSNHVYDFIVTGAGVPARFRISDNNATDNYGQLRIRLLASDATGPTITPHITPGVQGDHGYYTQPQTVTWDVADPDSAVASTSGCGSTTVSVETNGTTLTCSATNILGETTSSSVTLKYDGTAPVIMSAAGAPDGTNGWYVSPPTVTWSEVDAISGVDHTSGCAPATVTVPTAGSQITCSATNGAGLTGTSTFSYKYDPTPPTVVPMVTGTFGANGWYKTAPTVTWAVADDVSGIAATDSCDAVTQTVDTSGITFTCTATNGAGASNSAAVSLKYDGTAPTVVWAGNTSPYDPTQTVSLTCTATDATSGLASNSCANVSIPAYTLPIGGQTFSATAVDNAGNSTTAFTTATLRVTEDNLCSLVTAWVSNKGIANSLCVKVRNKSASGGTLDNFRNEVSAQSGKALTTERAAVLNRLSLALG